MDNNRQLREMHLFAGAGGGILGGMLCGHRTVCAVEIEEYPRKVLLQRQLDGILPRFPIWDDVCTFDGKPWRGSVDIICGGFPCQDISSAGKGAGITGSRSGLWKEYARIIDEVRPKYVFAENSPLLRTRGLGVVLEDLAAMGYDARWGVLGAWHAGAPHKRDRMWVLAHSNVHGQPSTEERESTDEGSNGCKTKQKQACEPSGLCASRADCKMANSSDVRLQEYGYSKPEDVECCCEVADTMQTGLQRNECAGRTYSQGREEQNGSASKCCGLWWREDPAESTAESFLGRVANGVAFFLDILRSDVLRCIQPMEECT